mgnify:CR=1 FL=1
MPAIAVVTEPFRTTGEAMADELGDAGLPLPRGAASDREPRRQGELDERADRLVEQVVALRRRASR